MLPTPINPTFTVPSSRHHESTDRDPAGDGLQGMDKRKRVAVSRPDSTGQRDYRCEQVLSGTPDV